MNSYVNIHCHEISHMCTKNAFLFYVSYFYSAYNSMPTNNGNRNTNCTKPFDRRIIQWTNHLLRVLSAIYNYTLLIIDVDHI